MNQNTDQTIEAATRVVGMVADCHDQAMAEGNGGAFFGLAAMDYVSELLAATLGLPYTADHLEKLAKSIRNKDATSCGTA